VTPYVRAHAQCDPPVPCRWLTPASIGTAGSERGPIYSSLDVLADWSGRTRGIRFQAYVQIHNVLDHDNDVTYSRECAQCDPIDGRRFGGGVGRVPLLGVRASF
jgi:hypothetical protein